MTSKQALEELKTETIKGETAHIGKHFKRHYHRIIEKDLNILEIIKNKLVNLTSFKAHFIATKPEYEDYKYYCDNFEKYFFGMYLLTETEFKLLKEWLER